MIGGRVLLVTVWAVTIVGNVVVWGLATIMLAQLLLGRPR